MNFRVRLRFCSLHLQLLTDSKEVNFQDYNIELNY